MVPVNIPPLRERKEDLPLLVEHFLRKTSGDSKRISPDAMKLLMDYSWKGNVRELENVIERMALLSDKEELTPADLPC